MWLLESYLQNEVASCVERGVRLVLREDVDEVERLEPVLRTKVGRLLNDRMPTGVAVSPAMNHGGPYPATGHPAGPRTLLYPFPAVQVLSILEHMEAELEGWSDEAIVETWSWLDGCSARCEVVPVDAVKTWDLYNSAAEMRRGYLQDSGMSPGEIDQDEEALRLMAKYLGMEVEA